MRNSRKKVIIEQLEPRVLFSADIIPGLSPDPQPETDDFSHSFPLPWEQPGAVSSKDTLIDTGDRVDFAAEPSRTGESDSARTSFFAEPGTPNLDTLLATKPGTDKELPAWQADESYRSYESGPQSPAVNADGNGLVPGAASTPETPESEVISFESPEQPVNDNHDSTDSLSELVFIDVRTPDYLVLLEDLQRNNPGTIFKYVLLASSDDGLKKITDTLIQYESVTSVHIVSHGSGGAVQLGSVTLNDELVTTRYGELLQWSDHLAVSADILFYGCNLASTADGVALVEDIAALTGADIASSDDLTGNAERGGDWDFEFAVGQIETDVVFSAIVQANYQGILSTFIVDTTDDVIDATDGLTSLREAVIAANSTASDDTILLGSGVHTLTIAGTGDAGGDLDINQYVEIIGMADGTSVIDASGLTSERVFNVLNNDATFQYLTITGGDETGDGGGIKAGNGTAVVVDNVVVTGNSAGASGGGISTTGTLTLTNSTISLNDANTNGGGISAGSGVVLLDNVTVSDNNAVIRGGGVYLLNGSHDLTNVTVSGNTADEGGGVVIAQNATGNLYNATITDNTAAVEGGGIFNIFSQGTAKVTGSIIAGNHGPTAEDVSGTISSVANNIIADETDLLLGPLADNGGAVQTHELLPGSVGIDGGAAAFPGDTDARGYFVADATRDIGAFENGATPPAEIENTAPIFIDLTGGSISYTEGSTTAVALDIDATVLDEQLSAVDDFGGAVLTFERIGGANADDNFNRVASGNLLFSGSTFNLNGVQTGSYSFSSGTLALTFDAGTSNADVNEIMQSIGYRNLADDNPPTSVDIQWTFNDGNTSEQGSGGALEAVGITTVNITAVNDLAATDLDANDDNGATGTDYMATFSGTPVLIADSDAIVVDPDSTSFFRMDVKITNLQDGAAESLAVDVSGYSGFNASYNQTFGSLVISGTGTHAEYEAILRAIEYDNSSAIPDTTARSISVQLTDGGGFGATSYSTIEFGAPTDLSSGIELNADGGNDAYLFANDGDAILGGLDSVTLEVMFSASDKANGFVTPLLSYKLDATSTSNDLLLALTDDGHLSLTVRGATLTDPSSIGTTIYDGNMHSVAATWDSTNGNVAFYLDGALQFSFSPLMQGQVIASGGEIVFGQEQDTALGGFESGEYLNATLYDVRIWDEVRTAADIALNYQNKFDSAPGSLPAGLVANWQMDGFDGSSQVVDIIGGNNLSIGHATGAGYIASTPVDDLHIAEDAANGMTVGYAVPTDTNEVSSSYTFTLTDSSSNFEIDNSNGEITVATTNTLDYETNPSHTHDVTVEVTDTQGGVYSEVMTITVDDANDSPVVDGGPNLTLGTINANETDPAGITVADMLASGTGDPISDQDISAVEGIAIAAANNTDGSWQYSLNSGGVWSNFPATTTSNTLLLDPSAMIRFIPSAGYTGTEAIAFFAWDKTDGRSSGDSGINTVPERGNGETFSLSVLTATVEVAAGANDAPTFDIGDGVALADPSNSNFDNAYSMEVLSNGKTIVAGTGLGAWGRDFTIVQYNADGSLDTSFGTNGVALLDSGNNNEIAYDIAVQNDGKIVVAGESGTTKFGLARFNSDGSVDTTFGTNGYVNYDASAGNDRIESVALDWVGNIIVTGYINGTADDFVVARFDSSGAIDTTFGSSGTGLVSLSPGGRDSGQTVQTLSNGSILIGGRSNMLTSAEDFVLVKLDSGGLPDTDFGTVGVVTTDIGSGANILADITVQPDGKIVVAGSTLSGTHNDIALVRYEADGTLDSTFGTSGIATLTIATTHEYGVAVDLHADGSVIVTGRGFDGLTNNFVTARFDSDGILDNTFGTNGVVILDLAADDAKDVAVTSDGSILIGGSTDVEGTTDFSLIKLDPNGAVDLDFARDINTLDGNPAFVESGSAVALDLDVEIFDLELSGIDDFTGSTLTISRSGGADPEDVFSAIGSLGALTEGGDLLYNLSFVDVDFGNVIHNSGGELILQFDGLANPLLLTAPNSIVNSIMQSIAYSNSSDTPPDTVELTWTFDDGNTGAQGTGGALTAVGNTIVDITAVNNAPVLDTTGPMMLTSITEDDVNNNGDLVTDIILSAGGDRITDADTGDPEGIAIVGFSLGDNDWEFSIDGGSTWTPVGDISSSEGLLLNDTDRLRFVPHGDNGETAALFIRAWDQSTGSAGDKVDVDAIGTGGSTAFSLNAEQVTISTADVNDAPEFIGTAITPFINEIHYDDAGLDSGEAIEIAGPAGTDLTGWSLVTYNGAGGVAYGSDPLSGVIADQGNGFGTFVVNYSQNGLQNGGNDPDGIALIDGSGNVVQFLSYEGTFTAVNGAAAGLTSTDIGVAEANSTNAGTSIQLTDSGWVNGADETFGAQNTGQDVALLSGNYASETIAEGTTLTFSSTNPIANAITIGDADANGAELAITVQVSEGVLSPGSTTALNNLAGDGTGTITFTGTIVDINNTLQGLTYNSDDNFNGVDQLTITVDDQGSTGGGSLTDVAKVAITVTGVNDAPVLDNSGPMTLSSIGEDSSGNAGDTVAAIIASAGGDRITDVDPGALEGIVIYYTDTSNGAWEYSIDGGGSWLDLGTASPTAAKLLDPTALIRFEPGTDFNGTAAISFKAWDQTAGVAGDSIALAAGSDSLSAGIESATVTVTPVNDAPVVDLNGSDGTGIDYSTSFVEPDSPVAIADIDATITDVDHVDYKGLGINLSGFVDGTDELIRINGVQFEAGDSHTQLTAIGSTAFELDFDGSGFTITRDGGGSIPQADWQALLRSITYENISTVTDGDRTLTIIAEDADLANASPASVSTISVSAIDDIPVVDLNGAAAGIDNATIYIENAAPVMVAPAATIDDLGEADIVQLNLQASAEVIVIGAIVLPNGTANSGTVMFGGTTFSYSYDGASTFDFVSSAVAAIPQADMELLIRAIQYQNPSDAPVAGDRTFTFTAIDAGGNQSVSSFATADVQAVNDAPTTTPVVLTAIAEDSGIRVITQAQLLTHASDPEGDGLVASGLMITAGSGVLSDNGDGTWNYTPASDYDIGVSFNYTIDDGTDNVGTTAALDITLVNDAPTVDLDADDSSGTTGLNYSTSFAAGGAAVAMTDSASVGDIDSTIETLTIQIANIQDGLSEQFSGTYAITLQANYNGPNSTLTLTNLGSANNADFQAALNSLTYQNTSPTPDTTTRVVTVVASDGAADSLIATTYIAMTSDVTAPTVVNNIGSSVNEGATDLIQTAELSYTDDLQPTGAIVYGVTSATSNGFLALMTDPATPITSFNQADIDTSDLVYFHDGSETLDDSFTFTVDDGQDNSLTGQIFNISIVPQNDAPVNAVPGTQATDEDIPLLFNSINGNLISISDSDAENSLVQVTVTSNGNGTVTLGGTAGINISVGSGVDDSLVRFEATQAWANIALDGLTFNPTPDYTGTASIAILTGDFGNSGAGSDQPDADVVTIEVNSINDEPNSNPVTVNANEDDASIAILFSGSDVDGTITDFRVENLPPNGTLYLDAVLTTEVTAGIDLQTTTQARTLYFVPDVDWNGTTLIEYLAKDDQGVYEDSPAISTIVVDPINDAPDGIDHTITLTEDGTHTFDLEQFGYSDIDSNGYQSVLLTSVPASGGLTLAGVDVVAGQEIDVTDFPNLLYTAGSNVAGAASDIFTFQVRDDGGTLNGGADTDTTPNTISIDILPVNDSPVILVPATQTVLEDTPLVFSAANGNQLTITDMDAGESDISLSISVVPGSLSLSGTAGLTFSNGDGTNDSAMIIEGKVAAINTALDGATYHAPLNYAGTAGLSLLTNGPGNTGPGGGNSSDFELVNIDITAVNDAPTATNALLTGIEDTPLILQVSDFGYSDPQDASVFHSVIIDALPARGQLLQSGVSVKPGDEISVADISAGSLAFLAADNNDGNAYDEFRFRVRDGDGTQNGGNDISVSANTAFVNIAGINNPPEGNSTTVQTDEDTPYVLVTSDFPFTDDVDGDAFSGIYIISTPVGGVLTLSGTLVEDTDFIDAQQINDGALVFTPLLNYVSDGNDTLGYLVSDNGGTSNGGLDTDPNIHHISFDINAINDAPQIITNTVTLDEGSDKLINSEYLSGSDVDDLLPEELTYTLQSRPDNGELSRAGVVLAVGDKFTLAELIANPLRYEHDGSETSSDFVDLSLADGGEDGAAAALGRLSFIINEVLDQAPSIEDDQLILEFGKPFRSADGDLLASGFATLSGNLLQEQTGYVLTIENPPEQGALDVEPNGQFTYVHNSSAVLQDEFTYRITNEDGVYTLATVGISIDPPIAAAIDGHTTEDIPSIDKTIALPSNIEKTDQQIGHSAAEITPDDIGTPDTQARSDKQETNIVIDLPAKYQNIGYSKLQSNRDPIAVKQHNSPNNKIIEPRAVTTDNSFFEFVLDSKPYGISNYGYLRGLTQLQFDFADAQEEADTSNKAILTNETIFGITFSATAGVVAWVLRGGALLASVVAATPIWASIDPIRVLNSEQENDKSDDVENLFDNNTRG